MPRTCLGQGIPQDEAAVHWVRPGLNPNGIPSSSPGLPSPRGYPGSSVPTPNLIPTATRLRLWPSSRRWTHTVVIATPEPTATALRLSPISSRSPRVGPRSSGQPWAGGLNAVGVALRGCFRTHRRCDPGPVPGRTGMWGWLSLGRAPQTPMCRRALQHPPDGITPTHDLTPRGIHRV